MTPGVTQKITTTWDSFPRQYCSGQTILRSLCRIVTRIFAAPGVNLSQNIISIPIMAISRSRPCSQNYSEGDTATTSLPAANVTPCDNTRTSIEQLMSPKSDLPKMRCVVNKTNKYTNMMGGISPAERADISYAVWVVDIFDSRVCTWRTCINWPIITPNTFYSCQHRYGILRDNLPPSLEYSTSDDELLQTATSIEKKLYRAAKSPQGYRALSTLEFRITALATAVLIHSDEVSDQDGRNISDTCARLSAAARKSLVYCVMILVSYEKQKLDNGTGRRMASERREESWQTENLHQEQQLHWKNH